MRNLLFLAVIALVGCEGAFAQTANNNYGTTSNTSNLDSNPAFEQNRKMLSDEQRIMDAYSKRKGQFQFDTTYQRVTPQTSPVPVNKFGAAAGRKSYSEMLNNGNRPLPGYEPVKADKPVGYKPNTTPNTVQKSKYSATIDQYVKNKYNQASPEEKSVYNQLMSEQHFNTPHRPGPLAVPKGDYIHVMKDKRARNYFQGK